MKNRKDTKEFPIMLQIYFTEKQVELIKKAAAKATGGMFSRPVSGYIRATMVAAAEALLSTKKSKEAS